MDTFSGSTPRKFIPLRLDIPKDGIQTPTIDTNTVPNTQGNSQPLTGIAEVLPPVTQGLLSGSSNSSGEDVNAFASRMTDVLNNKLQNQNIDPQPVVGTSAESGQKPPENFLHQPNVDNPPTSGGEETGSELLSFPQLNLVHQNVVMTTDMSDLSSDESHLYGVGKNTHVPTIPPSSSFHDLGGTLHVEKGYSDNEAEEYRRTVLTEDREMCANARLAVRKYFADNDKFNVPSGHPAVVFSEPQMYHMLRAISDESVMSSFGLTKNLVFEATGLRPVSQSRNDHRTLSFRKRQRVVPSIPSGDDSDGRGELPGSESELDASGDETVNSDGESSGAMHTGDEVDSVPFVSEKIPTDSAGFLQKPTDVGLSSQNSQPEPSPISSHGSSEMALAQLSEKCLGPNRAHRNLPDITEEGGPQPTPSTSVKPLSRKSPAKLQVLKKTYSAGMTWTRTFVCGPKDPVVNEYIFTASFVSGIGHVNQKGLGRSSGIIAPTDICGSTNVGDTNTFVVLIPSQVLSVMKYETNMDEC